MAVINLGENPEMKYARELVSTYRTLLDISPEVLVESCSRDMVCMSDAEIIQYMIQNGVENK